MQAPKLTDDELATLGEAERLLAESLSFIQEDGKWKTGLRNIDVPSLVQECREILVSQSRAKAALIHDWAKAESIGSLHEDQSDLIALLAWRNKSQFELSRFGHLFQKAVEENDFNFLRAVGHALDADPEVAWNKVDFFLVKYWTDTTQGHPPLCFFTDQALADLFGKTQRGHPVGLAALRKRRQRLKLRQGNFFHVKSATVSGTVWNYVISANPRGT